MTEKEMTIEEALELAVKILNSHAKSLSDMPYNNLSDSVRKYQQAAAVLRQIGKPVERSGVVNCDVCRACGHIYNDEKQKGICDQCDGYDGSRLSCDYKPMFKRWTETPVLKRVIKTSEPTYEPVESEE